MKYDPNNGRETDLTFYLVRELNDQACSEMTIITISEPINFLYSNYGLSIP